MRLTTCCGDRAIFAPSTIIDELRGVGRVELAFDPDQRAYVLIGNNGVGKTKTLEALFQVAVAASEAYGNTSVGTSKRSLVFKSVHLNGRRFDSRVMGSPLDEFDYLKIDTAHACAVVYAGAQGRGSANGQCQTNVSGKPLGTEEQRRDDYRRTVGDGMDSGFKALNMQEDIDRWFVLRAQSANRYQASADNRVIEIMLRLLNGIDPRIDSEYLEISGSALARIKVAGEERQLDELSSGFAAIVRLVQTIVAGYGALTNETDLQNVAGMVFIDEIESHLHLQWQSKIVRLLVDLFPNTTFYCTTHSPIVVAQCRPGEAYRLERRDHIVRSLRFDAPGRMALIDLLNEAFDVDVNELKADRMDPQLQREAKASLLNLVRDADR